MAFVNLKWTNSSNPNDAGDETLPLPITIGRSQKNNITLTGKQTGVSRQHAEVGRNDQGLYLADLNSRNGTRINGERIRVAPIKHGAKFEIGLYHFELQLQVICTNDQCQRSVDIDRQFCPHCGRFIADAQTHIC